MRKVSLGFKGDPNLKWEIKQEAEEAGMTSSEYLETIVENRHVQEDVKSLRFRIRQAIQEKDNIQFKLEEYENRLIPLYRKYKGQTLPFRNANGSTEKKTINNPIDLLDCILFILKIYAMSNIQFDFNPLAPNAGGGSKFPWGITFLGLGLFAVVIAYIWHLNIKPRKEDAQEDSATLDDAQDSDS